MTGLAVLAVYLLGFVATWRRAAWIIAHHLLDGLNPDGFDIGMGIFLGAVAAAFWPIVAPFYLLHRSGALTGTSHGFLKPPGHIARKERERDLELREQRIAQMEAEVGIHDLAAKRRARP